MENTHPAKTEKPNRYCFCVNSDTEYVAVLWLTLPDWYLPVIGDDISFNMEGEPMPLWVETSEEEWEKVRTDGMTITKRMYYKGKVSYQADIW